MGKKQKRWSSFKGHAGQLYLLQMEINKAEMQAEEDVPQSCKAVWQRSKTWKSIQVTKVTHTTRWSTPGARKRRIDEDREIARLCRVQPWASGIRG